ncbi:hypothetical protein J5X84_44330 [Streptosporangiaceae bacterium NEAU-GS5]|nr:hypothetical protein [Streptosporangiaceae bacterium NEAU-GS5]
MTFRIDLSERALSQLGGFPSDALSALALTMGDVSENPYDPLITMATDDPQIRRADFGDHGFVTFLILDSVEVVRVVDIIWAG